MRPFSLFLLCFFLLSASAQDGNLGLDQGNADVKNHLLQVDLLSLAGGVSDLRFEAGLNERSSMSIRGVVLEEDSLAASFFALSYRMYPIQALGNAPKGFYIGPRMYRGSIAEMVPDGEEPVGEDEEVEYEWNEVVSGLGFGFENCSLGSIAVVEPDFAGCDGCGHHEAPDWRCSSAADVASSTKLGMPRRFVGDVVSPV